MSSAVLDKPVDTVPQGQRTLRVAVVVPAYDEEGKIGAVVRKVPADYAQAIFVVDDCSRDGTAREARAAGATVLRHETNRGVGAAIRTGIDHARAHGYEVVAVLSGDDQHDPRELPRVLDVLQTTKADLVQGSRRLDGLRTTGMSWFRRCMTWVYTVIFRLLSGYPSTDATNGFRAFRLSLFDDQRIDLWQDWLDRYELEPYLLYQSVRCGKHVVETPVTVTYHDRGTTKMAPIADWWRILRPLVLLRLGVRK